MKAWCVQDRAACENYSVLIYAETRNEARVLAMSSDELEGAEYTDLRATRLKEMDAYYRGEAFIDWFDPHYQIPLVRDCGWRCFDPDFDFYCKSCAAKEYCSEWEDYCDELRED